MDSLSFNAMPAFESVGSFQVDQASIQEKKERLKAKNRKYYIENKERLNAYQKRHQAENKCPHDKCKSRCLECGGNESCQHKKMKQRCVDCRGSQAYEETNDLLVFITQTFSRGSDGQCTVCITCSIRTPSLLENDFDGH